MGTAKRRRCDMRVTEDEAAAGAASEGRYDRQSLIGWWDQDRLARARFLVIGAGALGNEVLKLLALMGAGSILVYDMDRIERSNLSRGVLFREGDEGLRKAEVAVRRLREMNPEEREAFVQEMRDRLSSAPA